MKTLIVFVKAPIPGKVKTRLCPPLSHAQAAFLYKAFARDTVALARRAGPPHRLEIAYAAGKAGRSLRWLTRRPEIKSFAQKGRGLGERLAHALARGFSSGSSRVVVIGSDTPHLEPAEIGRAFAALERSDVVLGPAQDGGYYLVGLRQMNARLFSGIPWSSSKVLEATLRRAAEEKLSVKLLARRADVDTPQDLARLARAAARSSPARFPETRRILRSLPDAAFRV